MSIINQPKGVKPAFGHGSRSTNQNKVAHLSTGKAVAAGYHPALKPGKLHNGNGITGSAKTKTNPKSGSNANNGMNTVTRTGKKTLTVPTAAAKGIM